ncbi:MAG: hypothetical protein IJY73_10655 [Oscillospiraceae bacterium]|nr:hypothetical protein [Oscillospiraceae bacterium]MBQ8904721.1 hypothetical protein [Oscillospiraceae bacterium]
MEWKKLIRLLYPPVWIIALLVPICTAALIYTFIGGYEAHPVAYFTYVLSFYTLTVVVMRCIKVVPKQYRAAKKKIYDNPIGNRYFTDHKFKTHVILYRNLAVNILYVGVNIVSGFLYHTAWFFILAFYYTILAVMRFLLVRFVNHVGIGTDRFKELRRSRLCGYILLTVNLALSAAVLMILYQNKGYEYHGILIYVMAAYTFYITTLAIINLIKYRKLGSPVMSMAKIINMAAALVSMLSLETAMFSQFGKDMSTENKQIFIMLTGAGVSIVIITMSVYSIVKNSKEIKKIMENDTYGE